MTLEERVQRLEARVAIEECRFEYCYRIDARDWDGLIELFTEDATLDYGGLGTYEGHDGVRKFAEGFVATELEATAHAVHNPVLDVDGDRAIGQWYVTSPITYTDGTGGFRMGQYRERYRRVDDDWKISNLCLRFLYAADYEDGWSDFEVYPLEK